MFRRSWSGVSQESIPPWLSRTLSHMSLRTNESYASVASRGLTNTAITVLSACLPPAGVRWLDAWTVRDRKPGRPRSITPVNISDIRKSITFLSGGAHKTLDALPTGKGVVAPTLDPVNTLNPKPLMWVQIHNRSNVRDNSHIGARVSLVSRPPEDLA